ncbi:MAG: family 43 glycosylhydrolase [Bacteroidota bacterium]
MKFWNQLIIYCFLSIFLFTCQSKVPSPLFIDSNYHGSADPEIIWNEAEQQWYIYYTARRPALENTWLRTPIGVITSKDLINWSFKGYCKFDGEGGSKDEDETFWAPAIIAHQDKLHMFVTYKPDTTTTLGPWGGPGAIIHYEAPLTDPIDGWKKVGNMHSDSLITIDASVYQTGSEFHVWYKGKVKGNKKNELFHLTSKDLYNWESQGFSKSDVFNAQVTGSGFEEAPYIFQWQDQYWLITDPHKGLFVYQSTDGENWNFQGSILKEGGTRKFDSTMARHCSVAVIEDRAFIFYHVEPWRQYEADPKLGKKIPTYEQPLENRRCVLQMAELEWVDGKIVCDRNKSVFLK